MPHRIINIATFILLKLLRFDLRKFYLTKLTRFHDSEIKNNLQVQWLLQALKHSTFPACHQKCRNMQNLRFYAFCIFPEPCSSACLDTADLRRLQRAQMYCCRGSGFYISMLLNPLPFYITFCTRSFSWFITNTN